MAARPEAGFQFLFDYTSSYYKFFFFFFWGGGGGGLYMHISILEHLVCLSVCPKLFVWMIYSQLLLNLLQPDFVGKMSLE